MKQIKLRKYFKFLSTLGPLGYLPASGTFGSIVGFIAVYFLFNFIKNIFYRSLIILFLSLFCFYIIRKSYSYFFRADPREIIIDEFAGSFFVFYNLNFDFYNIIWGFIIFRFLDISKLFGISYLERKFSGAFAIIIDDIAAGILTCIVLNLYNFLF